jgi:hypothetical protein
MRAGIDRWLRHVRDQLFMRGASADECVRSPDRSECETIAFAKIIAASTVLEFGGLPLELPMSIRRAMDRKEKAD